MKKLFNPFTSVVGILLIATLATFTGCTNSSNTAALEAKVDSLQAELKKFTDERATTEQRLLSFDTLDYEFYSNQQWDKFNHSHADNIKVFYPDGHVTEGLYPDHIDMLTPMFAFAPDTKIKEHPVKFGSGDWTAVIGVMEGSFSKPMPIGNGKTIPPNGKKFKIEHDHHRTLERWEND
ncbi:MAG TPA: polyketide cyclase [Bacteroidia bacterium]|nr:polyketide cyclase [Bacteroidia bacterium]